MTLQRAIQATCTGARNVAYLCGVVAFAVVAVRIGMLMELVTTGPLPTPLRGSAPLLGAAIWRLFEDAGLAELIGGDGSLLAGVVLVCAAGVVAARLRRARSTDAASVVLQVAVSLSVLAVSYRFPGLVALLVLLGWQLARRPDGRIRWLALVVIVALCVVPYDVSCRNLEGPARLETSIHCGTEATAAEYRANRRVCVGSDAAIYNEPTGVWVW